MIDFAHHLWFNSGLMSWDAEGLKSDGGDRCAHELVSWACRWEHLGQPHPGELSVPMEILYIHPFQQPVAMCGCRTLGMCH